MLQSIFKEIQKKVNEYERINRIDSEVFTKLAIPCPSVTVIDFCKIDPQQWISLHADIIIATDVVYDFLSFLSIDLFT